MYNVWERIVHKIKIKTMPLFAPMRRKKINNTDFTIISNNCWGGICYEYFGLKKNSPTVGCYFYAEDYIKFILRLEYYLNQEMVMITSEQSKHYLSLQSKQQLDVPIGKIDDIEIVFLHYKEPNIALEKWNRRVKRVNFNNIILKFSFMNECNDELISEFQAISGVKKVLFIGGKKKQSTEEVIYLPEYDNSDIKNDTFYWDKHIDVYELINKAPTVYHGD